MRYSQANLVLLGCAAIWGMSFLFQKAAMAHIGVLLFVAARSVVAAMVLAPFAIAEHRAADAPPSGQGFARLAVLAGLLFFAAAVVQQQGIVTASVTNAAFLTALYVVATPLMAISLLGARPTAPVWSAVALSVAGAWLLGGGGFSVLGWGEALVLVSTLLWALHVIVLGIAASHARPILLTAVQFAVAGTLALAGALAFEAVDPAALQKAAVDIAYVGVFSSALTFTLFAAAMRGTSPVVATIIVSSEAVFAAIGAHILLGERLTASGYVGAALILTAASVVHLASARAR